MRKIILLILFISAIAACAVGYNYYCKIFSANVSVNDANRFLFIKTGSNFNDVVNALKQNNNLIKEKSFLWVAQKMKYGSKILPGKYELTEGMNNKELVSLLRSGKQTPVNVTFNNIRTLPDFAGRIAGQLEIDSVALLKYLNDASWHEQKNISQEELPTVFIPNTYQFYWNTSAEKFVSRMYDEYNKFWNQNRLAKAKQLGLSPVQIATLASIVESETKKNDEKPVVAGVYLNRINKGWKLEADPTLVFAIGDFSIKRVLNEHKEVDSKYNTYLYAGLPPGPICLPEISSLEAVLNPSQHDYMYFCAREDLSGYHAFAKDYSQHLVNAKRYHSELNRRNIRS